MKWICVCLSSRFFGTFCDNTRFRYGKLLLDPLPETVHGRIFFFFGGGGGVILRGNSLRTADENKT